ncbi:MAG: hypothetical protein WBO97_04375 [Tepidiformaceae bacterium]
MRCNVRGSLWRGCVAAIAVGTLALAGCSGDEVEPTPTPGASQTAGNGEPFKGSLGEYEIVPGGVGLPTRTGFDACPGVGLEPAPTERAVVTAPGPLRIDPATMPAGIDPQGVPTAFLCRGELAYASWAFFAQAGTPDANPGGSPVSITRERGNQPLIRGAPAAQWSEVILGGLPGVAVGPARPIESCFAAVYNPVTDVQTTVSADGAALELCLAVIEAVLKR